MSPRHAMIVLLALSPIVVGCDRSSALPDPSTIGVATIEVSDATSARQEPVDPRRLEAGLAVMGPRLLEKHDGFVPVEVRSKGRYFLHPDADKIASITLDVSGLRKLTLAPSMEDFSSVKDCAGNPDAGVVNLSWSLDDKPPAQFVVDRSYSGTVEVDLDNASRLTIEVDQGNGVPWCDWMSMGFVDVVPQQPG